MDRFEIGCFTSDAGTRSHAQPADEFGGLVGEDVSEHVCRNDDIHLLGVSHHSSTHIIDKKMLINQIGVLFYFGLHNALNQAA